MAEALAVSAAPPVPPIVIDRKPVITPWAEVIAAVIGLRLLISAAAAGILVMLPDTSRPASPYGFLLAPWNHFDALWFTSIAEHGYKAGDGSTAYLPLYPFLVHMMAPLTGDHLLFAALLVSNTCCILGSGLFWTWVAQSFGAAAAWRALALLLVFPDSFFLLGAYSESLFLALSTASLLAARHQRLPLAGLLAALAILTRLQGAVLTIPILLALYRGDRRPSALLQGIIGVALPGATLLVYQKVLTAHLGGGGILDVYHRWWHIPVQTPWQTIWQYVRVIRSPAWHLINSPQANYILLWDLIIALAVLGVLVASVRRLGLEMSAYGLAAWCFAMTRWYSTGRYMLAVLPFFVALGLWADTRARFRWLSTICAVLLVFYVAEFAQGSWVD